MPRILRTSEEQKVLDEGTFADAVSLEMRMQDDYWGKSVERDLNWTEWAIILGKEYGEVLNDVSKMHWENPRPEVSINLRHELIQVAALCGQMIAVLDYRRTKETKMIDPTERETMEEQSPIETTEPVEIDEVTENDETPASTLYRQDEEMEGQKYIRFPPEVTSLLTGNYQNPEHTEMPLFRDLSEEEVEAFRQHARENHVPGEHINEGFQPVWKAEARKMDAEITCTCGHLSRDHIPYYVEGQPEPGECNECSCGRFTRSSELKPG